MLGQEILVSVANCVFPCISFFKTTSEPQKAEHIGARTRGKRETYAYKTETDDAPFASPQHTPQDCNELYILTGNKRRSGPLLLRSETLADLHRTELIS